MPHLISNTFNFYVEKAAMINENIVNESKTSTIILPLLQYNALLTDFHKIVYPKKVKHAQKQLN